MNYANCKRCGNLFIKAGVRNICSACIEKEEEDFIKVKDYLYEYPNASLEEVAEQTEVKQEIIMDWVKDGRLETKGITLSYPCELCGRPIHVGRICRKCSGDMDGVAKGLESSINAGLKEQLTVFSKNKK